MMKASAFSYAKDIAGTISIPKSIDNTNNVEIGRGIL
jgi:hypothetical protein